MTGGYSMMVTSLALLSLLVVPCVKYSGGGGGGM